VSGRARRGARALAARAALPLLAAGLAACDSPTIPAETQAYDFTFATDPPSVLRWPAGATIRVYVSGGEDAERAALLRDAFREAAAQWEEAVLFREFRFAEAARVEDADVVVFWSGDPIPVDTAGCPPASVTARGLTWSCPDEQARRLRPFRVGGEPSRVRMMVYISRAEASDPAGAKRVVLHELGHVLGIGRHSPNMEDVMAMHVPVDRLSAADRATVQVLYHVAPDIVP
jgi:predicted Zn-dependent protease